MRHKLMTAVLMIVIGLGALLYFWLSSQFKTVKLSNQKSVSLGQLRTRLIISMGNDIKVIAPDVFRYPGDSEFPAEAVIYVKNSRVAAILITGGENRHVASGAGVGMSWPDLKQNMGFFMQPKIIDLQADAVKQRGYKVEGFDTASYYITAACSPVKQDRLTTVAIVSRGHEGLITQVLNNRSCS